jgi:hypothetical protein
MTNTTRCSSARWLLPWGQRPWTQIPRPNRSYTQKVEWWLQQSSNDMSKNLAKGVLKHEPDTLTSLVCLDSRLSRLTRGALCDSR